MGLFRMGPPEDLITRLAAEFTIENFVETGTYEGWTAGWAAERFKNVFTIEMSKHFYERARQKHEHLDNVDFIFGDSRTELKKLADKMEGATIFWLDAHWSGGETYGGDDQCPILEEIEIINRCGGDSFIFIDDARLFTSPPQPPHRPEQWANIAAVFDRLQAAQADKYIVIIEDVIIAVPPFAQKTVARYCQEINARLWKEYGERHGKSNFRKGAELIYADVPAALGKPKRLAGRVYNFIKRRRAVK